MPSPAIKTEFASPDPNATPLNLVQLFQLANELVSSTFQDDYIPYVLRSGTPDVRDQDKVWIEKDTQGRPVAIRVYWSGSWRRVYNGMLGEIRGYTGNPGTDFDANGLGKVGLEYDGWHLCNGKDGAPDFSDKFLLAAHMNNKDHNGYIDNEWVAWLGDDEGKHTGGRKEFTLDNTNTFQPSSDIGTLKVGTYTVDGGGVHLIEDGLLWGKPSFGDETKNTELDIQSGESKPEPISIIPPFIALGWIIFVGYRS